MKKQILNLGKQLTKNEQKEVFGGWNLGYKHRNWLCTGGGSCSTDQDCCNSATCETSNIGDGNGIVGICVL